MAGRVKRAQERRRYESPHRQAKAAETRRAVLEAALDLFGRHGYAATTVADIAASAGVAVDTVYAAVGRKPALLRALVETAISGTDDAVPAEERDYVVLIRAADTAREKLAIYAAAVAAIGGRMAPVHRALRQAAVTDPACAELRDQINERRAANMRLFAADLRATGELRSDLSDDDVADVVWSMNAAEFYDLLVVERGWSTERFRAWLFDAWTRVFLEDPPPAPHLDPPQPRRKRKA
jgi:AcrR family transcriptional regulator